MNKKLKSMKQADKKKKKLYESFIKGEITTKEFLKEAEKVYLKQEEKK